MTPQPPYHDPSEPRRVDYEFEAKALQLRLDAHVLKSEKALHQLRHIQTQPQGRVWRKNEVARVLNQVQRAIRVLEGRHDK